MRYQVVEAKNAKALTADVNKLVENEGWRPQGSVSIAHGGLIPDEILVQALVKD